MSKKINLLGQRFGKLVVIEEAPNKGKRTQWKCLCDCGKECIVLTERLRAGVTKSCGCLHSESTIQRNKARIIDLTGQKFGKLTVIKQAESYRGHSAWECQCECGNIKIVNSVELKRGEALSCGCLRTSFGELKIEKILKENNIPYIKEYCFPNLLSENNVPLRFDFGVFDNFNNLQYLIEYDGEQHYLTKTERIWTDTLEQRKQRDEIKNQYCKEHNIPLIRIPYWEKNNLSYELITNGKYLI